jgi:hypothetical protein
MSERALVLYKAEPFQVPAIVADVGQEATQRCFEFFTVPTHIAAIRRMFSWLTEKGIVATIVP